MYNFSEKRVLIGISGGINSMAVLCWLAQLPVANQPLELHLYYAHFEEHSPDTRLFVEAGFEYARHRFKSVICTIVENSVMEYFDTIDFIPHPKYSPCSTDLKIIPMLKYAYSQRIDIDLIGFIKTEQRRINRLQIKAQTDLFFKKEFPIADKDNNWCFEIVKQEIGWYPSLYDIKEKGKRVFSHNNCLPCKNMSKKQLEAVKTYYPAYYKKAMEIEEKTGSYFGREKSDTPCSICEFD